MDALHPSETSWWPRAGPAPAPSPARAFPTRQAAVAWLDAERTNLVAVGASAATQDHPHIAVRLSVILFRYLDLAGPSSEALAVHGLARDIARDEGDRTAEIDALMRLGQTGPCPGPSRLHPPAQRTVRDRS